MNTRFFALPLSALIFLTSGCDLARFTADTSSSIFVNAAPAIQSHWDYDLIGDAFPPSIVQLEGLLQSSPNNEGVILQLIQAYLGYAFGYVQDEAEIAELNEDFSEATRLTNRARLLCTRAKDLALFLVSLRAFGFEETLTESVEDFESFLAKHFRKEKDAEYLFWAAYAWGSLIQLSKDDMGIVAGVPYAKALAARSEELNPTYYFSSAKLFRAAIQAQELAGDLKAAKKLFEEVLQETDRKVLIVQYQYALNYAIKAQDRALFESLLQEIIDAKDDFPESRLTNLFAKRRAERLLPQIDELF